MTGSNSHSWLRTCMLYFNCFFVTVASILGTGILGLPVKLAHSGFWPFLTTLTFCLFMQISIVYMFVDVLQRAEFRLGKDAESLQARQAPGNVDCSVQTDAMFIVHRFASSWQNVSWSTAPASVLCFGDFSLHGHFGDLYPGWRSSVLEATRDTSGCNHHSLRSSVHITRSVGRIYGPASHFHSHRSKGTQISCSFLPRHRLLTPLSVRSVFCCCS